MSLAQTFRGVFTALITPMHENGDIDWARLESLVHSQVEAGVDGLVPVGTTGESPTLDTEQHIKVIEMVVKAAAGRVPVIAGTGANSTDEALYLTRQADIAGADAFLQVAPYYNNPARKDCSSISGKLQKAVTNRLSFTRFRGVVVWRLPWIQWRA